jgi:leucyl-tRNA synthetase
MVETIDLQQGATLQAALDTWVSHIGPRDLNDARYQAAFEAFDEALIETIKYMKDRRIVRRKSKKREELLTTLWGNATRAISPLDPQLSNACMMKGLGLKPN